MSNLKAVSKTRVANQRLNDSKETIELKKVTKAAIKKIANSSLDLSNIKTEEDLNDLLTEGKELTHEQVMQILESKKVSIKKKNEGSKRESIYSLEAFNKFFSKEATKIESKQRGAIRKKRDFFINNILIAATNKDTNALTSNIKSFNLFYKAIYSDNSYSVDSLAKANSDANTLVKINLALSFIKKAK